MASRNSPNIRCLNAPLDTTADIDVAAGLIDKKRVLKTALSAASRLRAAADIIHLSVPLDSNRASFLRATAAECLLRTDLLSQLFDITQSDNPELVLCVTGSFPASLSLSTSDIDVSWFGETFTPPEPVTGSPLLLHASMIQTGLSYLNSPHIRSCPTCDAGMYQHKCSCECRLAPKNQKSANTQLSVPEPNNDNTDAITFSDDTIFTLHRHVKSLLLQ
ncbi:hypothetical protein BLNAU_17106 [Blattamonas nauphoetae]|uniref:Uncharacterized protein n=1 Tax=Blattamonas nauphoetae TaxID=2049346 RepID=A0ABQ9XBF5_9EUKA|nr:hypothetical protein BLNAU_17106 [Blattamonas nauphoetae]